MRAELKAVEEAVRRAVAPLIIYTDSAAVVRAFEKGKAYACRATNDGADIWRRIWTVLEDFGDLQIRKVKAHTTAEDAAEGLIDPILQAGNAAADHFAVAARKLASQQSPCHSFDAHYARARAWYRHIISGIAHWQQDVFGDAEAEAAEEDDGGAATPTSGGGRATRGGGSALQEAFLVDPPRDLPLQGLWPLLRGIGQARSPRQEEVQRPASCQGLRQPRHAA